MVPLDERSRVGAGARREVVSPWWDPRRGRGSVYSIEVPGYQADDHIEDWI
jgi:hypothetical protein